MGTEQAVRFLAEGLGTPDVGAVAESRILVARNNVSIIGGDLTGAEVWRQRASSASQRAGLPSPTTGD